MIIFSSQAGSRDVYLLTAQTLFFTITQYAGFDNLCLFCNGEKPLVYR